MSLLKTWRILGITKSFLFSPLLLEPTCSFVSWVWSPLVLGLPSGRIMDPLFSLFLQSPALSSLCKGNHFSDVGGSPGKTLRGSKSWFWSHCWDPGKAVGGLLGHRSWVRSWCSLSPSLCPGRCLMPRAAPTVPQVLCFWLGQWDRTKQAAETCHLWCLFLSLSYHEVTLDCLPCTVWKYFYNGN